jgi:hypothetical protein
MRKIWIGTVLVAGLALVTAPLSAQQRQAAPGQPSIVDEDEPDQATAPPAVKPAKKSHKLTAAPAMQRDPDLDTDDQLAPSQIKQPMPAAVAEPAGVPRKPAHPATHAAAGEAPDAAPPAAAPKPPVHVAAAPRTVVACSGPFAKDSGMLALAVAFDSRNVTFTEVDAGGSKVAATIVYPKDPKKRLEVWWSNPGNRTGTYLIVIGGQSTWTAPGGMHLGLTLAQLEKLNHKPFKLKGFDKDGVATVSDWDGGALATLAGGCKSGVSLKADPKAAADAVGALTADKEYTSADTEFRAVKPAVSEILIGY